MFADHTPECACIGGAHGFAFENDGGVAVDQGAITDIAVTYDPTHIGCGPEHITRIDVIDVFHRPIQGHQMPTCWTYNALGRTSCARCIQDIGGVIAFDCDAVGRGDALLHIVPIIIAPINQIGNTFRALENEHRLRFVF